MRNSFPLLVGAALLILIIITNNDEFFADFKTGVLIGAGVVVFVLYPAYLRSHERRLTLLERREQLRDATVAQLSNSTQQPTDGAIKQPRNPAPPRADRG